MSVSVVGNFVEIHFARRDRPAQEYAILKAGRRRSVQDDSIECPELSGKTIQTLHIRKNTGDGTNLQIELTDGTIFSCWLSSRPTVKASLHKGGAGFPETLRGYEV